MLSPETMQALEEALSAVVEEAGDSPEYADLVASLTSAQDALQQLEGADGEKAEGADAASDDYSFDVAEKRMADRRKPKAAADAGKAA
ncbi:MAG TPA: hypothetical protein VFT50_09345 [Baekduia sp.]|nr:hypothetical protein [Baekduia sp.]